VSNCFKIIYRYVLSFVYELAPAASLVSVHHLRPRARLVGPVSV